MDSTASATGVAHIGKEASSYNSINDAVAAAKSGETVYVDRDINDIDGCISISGKTITLDGQGHCISRKKILKADGSFDADNSYQGSIFSIAKDGGLTLKDVLVDGGAPKWQLEFDNQYVIPDTSDATSAAPLIESDGTLTLNGVSIKNVAGMNNHDKWSGNSGALMVRSNGGSLDIENSTFDHCWNKGYQGAAVSVAGGVPLSIKGSKFYDLANDWAEGKAVGWDGFGAPAVFIGSNGRDHGLKPSISNSTFERCWSNTYGGAIICLRYAMDMSDCILQNIRAWHNGGAIIYIGDWMVAKDPAACVGIKSEYNNVTFKNCVHRAGWHSGYDCGGGVCIAGTFGAFDFNSCTFDGCKATFGGAVSTSSDHGPGSFRRNADSMVSKGAIDLNFNDCMLENNVGEFGGAIFATNANVVMRGCTLKNNTADADQDSHNGQIGRGGAIFISSNYGNTALGLLPDARGNATILTGNHAQTAGGAVYVGVKQWGRSSALRMSEKSFIYGNTAGEAGDDVYVGEGSSASLRDGLDMGHNGARTKDAHVIDGWYLDGEGERYVRNHADMQKALSIIATANRPVALKADAQTYFIIFHPNATNVEGTMSDQEIGLHDLDSEVVSIDANEFKRAGWRFLGWATNPDGSAMYSDHQTLDQNLSNDPDGKADLYAVWRGVYTVRFDKNAADAMGNMDELAMDMGEAKVLPKVGFERSGYKFVGWALAPSDATKAYANCATVSDLSDQPDAVVTLYALWEKVPVSHNAGQTSSNNAAVRPSTVPKSGVSHQARHFVAANGEKSGVTSATVIPQTGDVADPAEAASTGFLGALLCALGIRSSRRDRNGER